MAINDITKLPSEILDKIFRSCDKESLVNLTYCSRISYVHVVPILYEVVEVKTNKTKRTEMLLSKDFLKFTKYLSIEHNRYPKPKDVEDQELVIARKFLSVLNSADPLKLKSLSIAASCYIYRSDSSIGSNLILAATRLVNLKSITLSSCKNTTSFAFVCLTNFRFLEKLVLRFCHISSSDFKDLFGLIELCIIGCTGLKKTSFDEVSTLVGLKKLTFCNNYISTDFKNPLPISFKKLKDLVHLERLDISESDVKSGLLTEALLLENLTYLKVLEANECILTNYNLDTICSIASLTSLFMHETDILDNQIKLVLNLKNLKILAVSTKTTDIGLKYIGKMCSLTTLDISGNTEISDNGMEYLTSLVLLVKIELLGHKYLTDTALIYLSMLPSLKEVIVDVDTSGITTCFSKVGLKQMSLLKGWNLNL